MSPARTATAISSRKHGTQPRRLARAGLALRAGVSAAALLCAGSARAELADFLPPVGWLDPRTAAGSGVILGVIIFATVLAILHVRERRIWTETDRGLRDELARLRGADDRADLLLGAERQAIVVWNGQAAEPVVEGDPTVAGEAATTRRLVAFGSWTEPADAARLESAVGRLRERGETFRLVIKRTGGGFVEAEGRTVIGRALLRLRDVSGDRSSLLDAQDAAERARAELTALRALLDTVDEPVWLRNRDGGLAWANRAYCTALEAPDPSAVASRSLELLDSREREASRAQRATGAAFRARVAAIVAGSRRVLDVVEANLPGSSGAAASGIARDVSEIEAVRGELSLQAEAHVRMLDQLPTAVATFDAGRHLVFHNSAYRQLWSLDAAFLDGHPTEDEILDRLRAERRLPEQADYRSWKAGILAAYRAAEGSESWWHLPDRRTLRVVANPTPGGGLTYLFDDVSDRMHLESRYNALSRTQSETLDALAEGVALFGSNGRLRLHNRAFAEMWRFDREQLEGLPHIQQLVELGRALAPDPEPWSVIASSVSGLTDRRERTSVRMGRADGTTLDGAVEPLPDGAALVTFVDVTASVNVERALTDRNEALEVSARLRNEFVHHVSYELRSPLTTIIGFAELLGAETMGPLNERQREYAGHITRSSGALLAIINDILDLASIDTETITLAREPVDILRTIGAAATGIEDRLGEAGMKLALDVPPGIGSFTGDSKRVRQILYNLLSNAAGFSMPGQTIRVTARKENGEVVISVADQGAGIPQSVVKRVFDRFESHTAGTNHHGAGLGLSIVRSFVELHGGHVELVSERGSGTTVTCHFPADGRPEQQLAAEMPPETDA